MPAVYSRTWIASEIHIHPPVLRALPIRGYARQDLIDHALDYLNETSNWMPLQSTFARFGHHAKCFRTFNDPHRGLYTVVLGIRAFQATTPIAEVFQYYQY